MKIHPASAEQKLGFDAVRAALDGHTLSRLGQERLEQMQPARHLDGLREELARVAEVQEALRFDDPIPTAHILDVRSALRALAPEDALAQEEDLLAFRLVLETTQALHRYFAARREKYPHAAALAGRLTPLPDLVKHLKQLVDDEGRLREDASPELRRIRRQIVRQQAALRDSLMRELRHAIGQGYATEEQPTIRNGRMVIPVRAEAKRKIQGFVQDTSATGQTVYIEPASVLDLNNEVRTLEGEERREVERLLREAAAHVRRHLDAFRDNLRTLGALDLLLAKARLSNRLDAHVPDLNDDGIIDVQDGRNPALLLHFAKLNQDQAAEAKRAVVPLGLKLGEDFQTLVITGPNAGGKSVAMKTIGLFALMLAYGLPLPAAPHSRFALFQRLIVDLGDEQSIEEDLSTFSSHVTNLKYMLRHADAQTLILIDEAGTGTDPAEGGALAQAVLERLTEIGARTLATTHHGSLKAFAHETDGVENGSMQFDRATLSPTYRFLPGIPGSSYAFEIGTRIGLPEATLDRARTLVGGQKTTMEDLLATFEARNLQLEQHLREAEATLRAAETQRQDYEQRLARLRSERDQLKQQALTEAERILQSANAQVERTIREIKEAEAAKEATQAARQELDEFKQRVGKRKSNLERKQQKRTRQQPKPKKPEEPPASSPLQVGDQVVVDGGGAAAEVLEFDGKEAVVAVGSMRMRLKAKRLQKVGGKRQQQVTVRQVQQASADLASLRARRSVDLRGYRVDEALLEVTQLLDGALAANLDTVEILHGKGTGALRQAIHDYLGTRSDVAGFEDAAWNDGGAGKTIVTMV